MLLPRRFGGAGVVSGKAREHDPLGIRHGLRLAAPAAQLLQKAEVRDLSDPCAHAPTLGIELSGVAPYGQV